MRVQDNTNTGGSGGLFWLYADHLGSTTLTARMDGLGGDLISTLSYTAWGETRNSTGATPTSYRYTGQREAEAGLYFYQARWYDPYLNRWTQPDTIIPDIYNPIDLDRYAYVRNNPILNNDPSGHMINPPHCSYCDKTWLDFSGVTLMKNEFTGLALVGCFFVGCHVDLIKKTIEGPTTRENMEAQMYGIVAFGADLNFAGITSELGVIRQLFGKAKGDAYELWLKMASGGEGSFSVGSTQFDNKVGNLLMEGKAVDWSSFTPTSKAFSDFQNQIGQEFAVATKQNTYQFEAHFLNQPPQFVIDWLEKKGIPYVIESGK
jgi:RHS repeat-associated protein